MTDTSSTVATQSTQQLFPVTAPALASPIINGSLSDTIPPEEDEPYTIKCICSFQDDDGNTVFCEKCETWQHIECYYHGRKVPEVHNCADCEPRPLDAKRATERQRRLREQTDGGDRRAKRPSSKSHKKKKDVEQTNGWHSHERRESLSASREQPPAKRPKTSHRPSGSVSSMNGTTSLMVEGRKRAHSSAQSYPSPTKSPLGHSGPSIPQYTTEFLQLYDNDQGKANLSIQDNFKTINVTGRLKSWLEDPVALSQDTNGRQYQDVFIQSDAPLNPTAFPEVSLQTLTNSDVEIDGRHPSWRILRLESDVIRDDLVGEIKGSVGLLRDYCHDESNRWHELRHPEPFVFFHPQLPIYIDSRREGTKFRYIRRSCRPNVGMKTYIDRAGEYHYCFVAKEDIPAGTELTAMWYLDQAISNRGPIKDEHPAEGENDPTNAWVWASRVLANFGDCACDTQQHPCMLASLDRRRTIASSDSSSHKNGRRKKPKTKRLSPPSNGRGSVSRAGSETVKTGEEDDQFDARSTSGSVRSKPRSRDITPSNTADSSVTSGLTDREKRKIAAAEKTFERLEQDQHGQKKKKRSSGGSSLNTSGLNASRQLSNPTYSQPESPSISNRPAYVDASTSRQPSASPPVRPSTAQKRSNPRQTSAPNTPVLPSPLRRPTYVDSGIQTDIDDVSIESPPDKRRKYTTLTQRLLKRCHNDRVKFEELEQHRITHSAGKSLPSPISPSANPVVSSIHSDQVASEDAEMRDVESSASASSPTTGSSPSLGRGANTSESLLFAAPSLPSQAAHTRKLLTPSNGYGLQLSNLPPIPNFSSPVSGGAPWSATPGSSQQQSPFALTPGHSYSGLHPLGINSANAVASPAKKKLSLGDYMSRRNATPIAEKSAAQLEVAVGLPDHLPAAGSIPLHPSESPTEEIKIQVNLDNGSAVVETDVPNKEVPPSTPTNLPSDTTLVVATPIENSEPVKPSQDEGPPLTEPKLEVDTKDDVPSTDIT